MHNPDTNYIEQATVTLSKNYHGEKVSLSLFNKIVENCIDALADLEAIKKTIFYGKELPLELKRLNLGVDSETAFLAGDLSPNTCANLAAWFANEEQGQVSIHGILGAAAETSELLQLLKATIEGQELNVESLAAEMGDVMWYFAILCFVNSLTFEQVQAMNIAKLKARYPDGFTKKEALNRDEDAEHKAMQSVA